MRRHLLDPLQKVLELQIEIAAISACVFTTQPDLMDTFVHTLPLIEEERSGAYGLDSIADLLDGIALQLATSVDGLAVGALAETPDAERDDLDVLILTNFGHIEGRHFLLLQHHHSISIQCFFDDFGDTVDLIDTDDTDVVEALQLSIRYLHQRSLEIIP